MRVGERVAYPPLVRLAAQAGVGAVDTARLDEIAPRVSIRLDVLTVDADRGRAEKPEPLCSGWRLYVDESHLRLDAELAGEALDKFSRTLMVRAAFEIEDLYEWPAQVLEDSRVT